MSPVALLDLDDPKYDLAFKAGLAVAQMTDALWAALLLIGLAILLQVVLLVVNKITQFYVEDVPERAAEWTVMQRVACRVSTWFWLGLVCDLGSIGLLALATKRGLQALGLTLGS